MKTTSLLNRVTLTLTYSLFTAFPAPSLAITDQEIVQGLEAVGDLQAAYPLAYQQAEQQNTYAAWRTLATKYAPFDQEGKAYLHVWQQAQRVNSEDTYRDFLTLRPAAALNLHAIHAIFTLVKTSDKVADYVRFMEQFPNTVEAMEALLRVQELAFARARRAHDPVIYDAFVTTFQGAKQVPLAIQLALAAERQVVAAEDQLEDYESHERLARRLYNEARLAEKEQKPLVVARRYALLTEERFRDTKVVTELFDREERLAFQKLMETKQTDIVNQIKGMQDAVVQTIQAQTQQLGDTIVKELQTQGQHLEEVIATHNRVLTQQLAAINQNIDKLGRQQVVMGIAGLGVSALVGGLIYQGFSQTSQSLAEVNQNISDGSQNNLIANVAGEAVGEVVGGVVKSVTDSHSSKEGTLEDKVLDVVGCATASVGVVTTGALTTGVGALAAVPTVWKCTMTVAHIVGPFIPEIKAWTFW